MADIKKEGQETPKEIDTTVRCGSCNKVLYKNEVCSCQRTEVPKWLNPLSQEIPLKDRTY